MRSNARLAGLASLFHVTLDDGHKSFRKFLLMSSQVQADAGAASNSLERRLFDPLVLCIKDGRNRGQKARRQLLTLVLRKLQHT